MRIKFIQKAIDKLRNKKLPIEKIMNDVTNQLLDSGYCFNDNENTVISPKGVKFTYNSHTKDALIYAIYEMFKYQKPLIERTVTISGEGIKHPANYRVKIGTNLSEIILKTEKYNKLKNPVLIAGGAMMGKSIPSDELIVTKDLNCILVLENKEEKINPCIKCGKCSEVCPRGLIPSMIISNRNISKDLHIDKCVGCGLCSYVCPAKIEIRDIIKKIKDEEHD